MALYWLLWKSRESAPKIFLGSTKEACKRWPNACSPLDGGGDFNEILLENEKIGGRIRSNAQMEEFRKALDDCDLVEALQPDRGMTWSNKRSGDNIIWERLDRFLVNGEWKRCFSDARIQALNFYGSDHRPLLMKEEVHRKASRGCKRFYFEEKWLLDPTFIPDFVNQWEKYSNSMSRPTRLRRSQEFLQKWAGSKFDGLEKRIKRLRTQRTRLLNQVVKKDTQGQVTLLDREIEQLLEIDESHWKVRARTNWLARGDRNTPAFHAYASMRKRRNRIEGLFLSGGERVTKEAEVANEIEDFFDKLFTSSNPSGADIAVVVEKVTMVLGEQSLVFLNRPYMGEEVKRALFEIHPSKSPGPDGYSGCFYQTLWSAMENTIVQGVLGVLNNGDSLEEWNKTLIVLIPKREKPHTVMDFRPISLCNKSYKIVSKVIVNRLRRVLHEIIDENQSAFVKGRQISDNIIVGFECMH